MDLRGDPYLQEAGKQAQRYRALPCGCTIASHENEMDLRMRRREKREGIKRNNSWMRKDITSRIDRKEPR
jgi:hypothetical protein